MKINPRRLISTGQLLMEAQGLKSEHAENLEYDRALLELITFTLGGTSDDFIQIGAEIGMSKKYVKKMYSSSVSEVR